MLRLASSLLAALFGAEGGTIVPWVGAQKVLVARKSDGKKTLEARSDGLEQWAEEALRDHPDLGLSA